MAKKSFCGVDGKLDFAVSERKLDFWSGKLVFSGFDRKLDFKISVENFDFVVLTKNSICEFNGKLNFRL